MPKLEPGIFNTFVANMAVESAFSGIKRQAVSEMKELIEQKNPEQSLLSLMRVMKVLITEFDVMGKFSRSDFQELKDLFYKWHDVIEGKATKKYHKGILELAEEEFEAFRKMRWPDE